jgi:hypothetical protein
MLLNYVSGGGGGDDDDDGSDVDDDDDDDDDDVVGRLKETKVLLADSLFTNVISILLLKVMCSAIAVISSFNRE